MRKHGKDVRRPVIPFVVAALALASASVAYAESFEGSRGANRYVGTADPDRVELYAGDDTAFGHAPGQTSCSAVPTTTGSTARTAATRS